jgi:hypothetical protein
LEPSLWDFDKSDCSDNAMRGVTKCDASKNGRRVFLQFQDFVWLGQVQRQKSGQVCHDCSEEWHPKGSACSLLKELLLSMRFGKVTEKQWKWLQQFQLHCFPKPKVDLMNYDSVWVFPTRKEASERNIACLQTMEKQGKHIVYTKAVDEGSCPQKSRRKSGKESTCALNPWSVLCVGAKVSLQYNLYIAWNLFNGSEGTIKDIIYLGNRKPSVDGDSFPDFILVDFPGYSGPPVLDDNPTVVPIIPIKVPFGCKCHCERTQIPLLLSWGKTCHKCQGMTVGPGHPIERMVVHLGDVSAEGRSPGIAFVCFSRVTTAGALGIAGSLNYDRLACVGQSAKYKRVRAFDDKVKEGYNLFCKRNWFLLNLTSLQWLVMWCVTDTSCQDVSGSETPIPPDWPDPLSLPE